MRCSTSVRSASRGAGLGLAAVVAAGLAAAPLRAGAVERQRSDAVRMPNVSIEGERQTPDIFFVFPTGKSGNVSAPRLRDYSADILEPVVKPWLDRDELVTPAAGHASSGWKLNWRNPFRSEPSVPELPKTAPAPSEPAPAPAPVPAPFVPEPQIPARALSVSPVSAAMPASSAASSPSAGSYDRPVDSPPPPRPHALLPAE